MFYIAPEIFVQSEVAIEALHLLIGQWSEVFFIQILPDLRYAFSQLNPKQTSVVAKRIAKLTGLSQDLVLDQVFGQLSEAEVLQGVQLNQQLQQLLAHDHLLPWFKHPQPRLQPTATHLNQSTAQSTVSAQEPPHVK